MRRGLIFFVMLFSLNKGFCSDSINNIDIDNQNINKKRLAGVLATEGTLYVGAMTGLYFAWYENYPQTKFHFFNDGREWCGMDKAGHGWATYNISRWAYQSLRWSNVKENKAIWYGALIGWGSLMTIEMFDGFSSQWGFSGYDMLANTIGTGLFIGQQFLWHEQRFTLKYSFHTTKYADMRPDLLGSNLPQKCLKDYNGQTIWLSANISSFIKRDTRFPKWLNIAFGYGAEGMLSGEPMTNSPVQRYNQFYLSVDVDFTRIKTRSKVLKTIFSILNCVKIPAPTIEFNTRNGGGPNVRVHPLYF